MDEICAVVDRASAGVGFSPGTRRAFTVVQR